MKRTLLYIAGAVLVVLAAGIIWLFTPMGKKTVQQFVFQKFEQSTGYKIQSADFETNLISRITFRDVTITDTLTRSSLGISELTVNYKLMPAFRGRVTVDSLESDGIRIHLNRNLLDRFTSISKDEPVKQSRWKFKLRYADVSNVQISYEDTSNNAHVLLRNIDALYIPEKTVSVDISGLNGVYQGEIVRPFSARIRGEYLSGDRWQMPVATIRGRETSLSAQGEIGLGESLQIDLMFDGKIGHDLLYFAREFLPEEQEDRITLSAVSLTGDVRYDSSLNYSGEIGAEYVQYDTIRVESLAASITGNNEMVNFNSVRTLLGSERDTLRITGKYDWHRKESEVNAAGHLSSLRYVKYFLAGEEIPVDSPVDFSLNASIPATGIEQTTGSGKFRFTQPIISQKKYSEMQTDITVSADSLRISGEHLDNQVEISGQFAWPFQFDGTIQLNSIAEFDSTVAQLLSPVVSGEFAGRVGHADMFTVNGELFADVTYSSADGNPYSVHSELPFQGDTAGFRIRDGSLKVNDLSPSNVRAGVDFSPQLKVSLDITEPYSPNGDSTLGNFHAGVQYSQMKGYAGQIVAENLSLQRWTQLIPRMVNQVYGNVNIQTDFIYTQDSLQGSGRIFMKEARFATTPIDSVNAQFHWDTAGLTITSGKASTQNLSASLDGYLPFSSNDSLHLTVSGERWPLDVANPFLPDPWQINGMINHKITVQGNYLTPSIEGQVEVDSGFVRWDKNNPPIKNFQARIDFSGRTFDVQFVHFQYDTYPVKISGEGTLTPSFNGEISLEPKGAVEVDFDYSQGGRVALIMNSVPVAVARAYIPLQLKTPGNVSGTLNIDSFTEDPFIQSNGVWQSQDDTSASEWSYRWNGEYQEQKITLNRSTLSTPNGIIQVQGSVPLDMQNGGITDSVKVDSLDLWLVVSEIKAQLANDYTDRIRATSGEVNGDISVGGTWAEPTLGGYLSGTDIDLHSAIQEWEVLDLGWQMDFNGKQFTLNNASASLNSYPIEAAGSFTFDDPKNIAVELDGEFNNHSQLQLRMKHNSVTDSIAGNLHVSKLRLDTLLNVIKVQKPLQGITHLSIALSGTRSAPEFNYTADVKDLTVEQVRFQQATFSGNYQSGFLAIDTLLLKNKGASVLGSGRVSADVSLAPFSIAAVGEQADFQFAARDFPLDPFEIGFANEADINGILNADVSYKKTETSRKITGNLAVTRFNSNLPFFQQKITSGELQLDFNGNRVQVQRGRLSIDKHPVQFAGTVTIPPEGAVQYDMSISTDQITLTREKIVSMTLAPSNLRLITRAGEPTYVEGTVTFNSFKYRKDIPNPQILTLIGTRTIRPQRLTQAMLEDIRLNLSVQMLKNATVQNNLADLEFTADVQLSGPLYQPRFSGRIATNSGEIFYLRRTFEIQNAQVFFNGTPNLNPDINIVATTVVPDYQNIDEIDYTFTLNITNTLRQPRIQLSSDPARRPKTNEQLTQSDIIGILAVGRPRDQFSGVVGEGNLTQTLVRQAEQFSSKRIASAVEYRVGRLLDLDKVAIEGNLFNMSGAHSPTFTAQKDLSKRLTLTYSTSIGHSNEQGIRLNYQLSPTWYLVTETNQQEEYGVDLKYRIKFK
ncbi:MAG: translocation/assembly module TamB domain-containing protein [Candidatus Marinimicrobia bacterium]|nr:translocation/assembly module TamB domain-containing protein [Candidatus Neomarinimicrobiota bacterium]MCF7828327.1 translocation/assembly module TamB domain-containing protein [Candidatus Neomarinimicrobiota bacterium]MCF7879498.1 translocation/assembly module TamB domain-containing protein [Candidatus Neomarinimicrobiota bacterium]